MSVLGNRLFSKNEILKSALFFLRLKAQRVVVMKIIMGTRVLFLHRAQAPFWLMLDRHADTNGTCAIEQLLTDKIF